MAGRLHTPPDGLTRNERADRRELHAHPEPEGPFGFTRDDTGYPLGSGMPLGRSLREDGETHREAWMRVLRSEPCSYCGGAGGTVDHVDPKSRPTNGWGGRHSWANYVPACEGCNQRKGSKPLLRYLEGRVQGKVRRFRPDRPVVARSARAAA